MTQYKVIVTYRFNSNNEITSTSKVVNSLAKAKKQQQLSVNWVEAHSKRFTLISTEIKGLQNDPT